MKDPASSPGIDLNARFLQAVAYLIEWVKHIITVGSALMVLGAAFLKDLVKGAMPPNSYLIAALLVLSYCSMFVAMWQCLAFIRRAASSVLTTQPILGSGDDLKELKDLLVFAQRAFLLALGFFMLLALVSLLTWAFRVS